MSASKYRWTPACDGQPCVGDCDLCRVDNLQSGIYTDNPDDTLRYVQTTVPVFDHWGYEKKQDDYVQVVRCKDCKYLSMTTLGMEYACWHGAEKVWGETGEHKDHTVCQRIDSLEHYCAYGERRSECSTP